MTGAFGMNLDQVGVRVLLAAVVPLTLTAALYSKLAMGCMSYWQEDIYLTYMQ